MSYKPNPTPHSVNDLPTYINQELNRISDGANELDSKANINTSQQNDIINGQFRIAQTGTSWPASSGGYLLDGWSFWLGGSSAGRANFDQFTSTTRSVLQLQVTTTDTSVTTDECGSFQTSIEGYDCVKYVGRTFTVGYWVYATKTGIHCLNFWNGTQSYVTEYTVNTTNTWEYKTITIVGGLPAIASFTDTFGIVLRFANFAGPSVRTTANSWITGNYMRSANQVNDFATVGNKFALSGVTMNLGTQPCIDTSSYEEDLRKCQRYSIRFMPTLAYNFSSYAIGSYMSWSIPFPVTMRDIPTLSCNFTGMTLNGVNTPNINQPTQYGFRLITSSTAINVNANFSFAAGNYFQADSRL